MENRIARVFIVSSILLLIAMPGASRGLELGSEAPDFVLKDTSDTDFALASIRGKIVIIAFWRIGQTRSAHALKDLQSIYLRFKEHDVEVLAIFNDESGPEAASKFGKSKQLTFPLLRDLQGKTYGAYEVKVAPSTFIIDKAGKISYYYAGYRADFPRRISGRVEVLLGKKTLEELQAELQPVERIEMPEGERKARRYLSMGNNLLEKGMARSAMKQYRKAVQEKPDLFEAHLHLGNIYLGQKKVEEANAAFKQAIELKPRSSDAHAGLGDVFFFQGHLEKSVEMLRTALKLNPKLARAHYRLGRVHEEQGQIEDALKEYKTALGILLKIKD